MEHATRWNQEVAAEPRGPRGALIFLAVLWLGMQALGADEKKIAGPKKDLMKSMLVEGYFDPESNFIDATAKLEFDQPSGNRNLWLAEGLQLESVRSGSTPVVGVQRFSNQCLFPGPSSGELELSYSGRLAPAPDPLAGSQEPGAVARPLDDCRFLSCIADFYPHPQPDFAAMKIDLRLPAGWNCLGSGTPCPVIPAAGGNRFAFDNREAKGMSLVCGRFRQIDLIAGAMPLRLHAWPGFRLERYYSRPELAHILSFYIDHFGPLAAEELNLLFRRGHNFGGLSFHGLLVLGVDDSWGLIGPMARKRIEVQSPLAMIDPAADLLAHELAHQWWGGLVSWNTATENWITEGLATYSTMLYAREQQGEKAWLRLRKHLRRWVARYAGKGAAADGVKLKLQQGDLRAYQAIVYIKPALMLAELAERIGEDELCRRLRAFLAERSHSNVGSRDFLDMLAAGDEALRSRLDEWIFGRSLPKQP